MRVDAHHHIWTMARGDYRWMSPELPIARDYGLDDLRPLLGAITATVSLRPIPRRPAISSTVSETDSAVALQHQ